MLKNPFQKILDLDPDAGDFQKLISGSSSLSTEKKYLVKLGMSDRQTKPCPVGFRMHLESML